MPEPPPLPPLPEPPATLVERVTALEGRISALEAILDKTQSEAAGKNDMMARLEWAVKHGRQRPW